MSDLTVSFLKELSGKEIASPQQDKVNDFFKRLVYMYAEKNELSEKPLRVSKLKDKTTDHNEEPVKLTSNNIANAVKWFNDTDRKYKLIKGNGGYHIEKRK